MELFNIYLIEMMFQIILILEGQNSANIRQSNIIYTWFFSKSSQLNAVGT